MNLSEFDLDLPYVADAEKINLIMNEKNCDYHEATKIDYDLNWKGKRRSFRLETRCVTALYERLFGKMKTDDCWKILIECVENINEERILNLSGVVTAQVEFSIDNFSSLSEYEKKSTTLYLLMKGIERISSSNGWAFEPFREISSQIEQTGYLNEWVWEKAVKSPTKEYYAEVICQHNVCSMDISIMIRKKDGVEIQRNLVIFELPDEFAYSKHLGKLRWLSDNEVALINKKDDTMVSITIE